MKTFKRILTVIWAWLTGKVDDIVVKVEYGFSGVMILVESIRVKVLSWLQIRSNLRHAWAGSKGAVGTGGIVGLFVVGMMAFILYIVVANFWPSAQTANTAIQANTATDSGTVVSKTMFSLGLWIIPVGIFITLFILLIRGVSGGGGGGGHRRRH
jgi:hypothetical protein